MKFYRLNPVWVLDPPQRGGVCVRVWECKFRYCGLRKYYVYDEIRIDRCIHMTTGNRVSRDGNRYVPDE
jgi:hypothetical protein